MRVPLLLLVGGCVGPAGEGTAVGNPGNLDVSAIEVPQEVSIETLTVAAHALLTDRCPGVELVEADVVLDGLAPSPVPVPLEGGAYCAGWLLLDPEAPIVATGQTSAGTEFTLELYRPLLSFQAPFTVDGDTLLLGISLRGIDAAELDALGPVVELPADDPVAEAIASTAAAGLWRDVNDDGRIDALDERLGVSVAEPSALDAECGCRTADAPAGTLVTAFLAFSFLRRRRALS